jgi:hypothetical protein
MDKVTKYRELIRELLIARSQYKSANDPIERKPIFDLENDHYQLVNMGWKDNMTRVYGCSLHLNIAPDGKIWIQQDGTEDAIAEDLVARGVPKQDIVLAYHAPNLRHYTEFSID